MKKNKTNQLNTIEVFRCLKLETEKDRGYFQQLAKLGQEKFEKEEHYTEHFAIRNNTQPEEDSAKLESDS